MGLDNGLVIRKRNQKVSKEIAYWRKCWNVRRDILDIINSTEEKYCYEISRRHYNSHGRTNNHNKLLRHEYSKRYSF